MERQPLQYQLPLALPLGELPVETSGAISSNNNTILPEDRAFHGWYRFVLSYPPHLVRDYIRDFGLDERSTILDPFCGTGTTLVEAKLNQIRAVGLETNPFPHFASTVKTDWNVVPDELQAFAAQVSKSAYTELGRNTDVPPQLSKRRATFLLSVRRCALRRSLFPLAALLDTV